MKLVHESLQEGEICEMWDEGEERKVEEMRFEVKMDARVGMKFEET